MEPTEVASHKHVAIVPYTNLLKVGPDREYHQGGPIWRPWPQAGFARHHGSGRPWDKHPERVPPDRVMRDGGLFWAGPIGHHFGHQIIDFSMRILGSCTAHPQATLLFSRLPDAPVPPFFRAITDWFEVDPSRIVVIDEPVRARDLHVVPQAEQPSHGNEPPERIGPSPAYLDLMDRFIAAKRIPQGTETRPVFLSRAGVEHHLAGEAYLEWAAAQAGALVVRPETLPLAEQMALVIGARTLIVTEGSAFHLLSLAGRQFERLDVLLRRPHQAIGKATLAPRCTHLSFVDLLDGLLCRLTAKGAPGGTAGLPIPNEARLIAHFLSHGVDMRPIWDSDDFADAVEADLRLWVRDRLRRAAISHPNAPAFLEAAIPAAFASHPHLIAPMRAALAQAAAPDHTGPITLPHLRPTRAATIARHLRRLTARRPRFPRS